MQTPGQHYDLELPTVMAKWVATVFRLINFVEEEGLLEMICIATSDMHLLDLYEN